MRGDLRRRCTALATGALALSCAGAMSPSPAAAAPPGSAYEKVSPADKSDGDVWFQASTVRSAPDGTRVSYQTPTGQPGDESVFAPTQHVSALAAGGWETHPIMPRQRDAGGALFLTMPLGYQAFAEDLEAGALAQAGVPLVPGAAEGVRNLYVRDFASGAYRLITPPPIDPVNPFFGFFLSAPVTADHTADMRRVAFESPLRLTPDTPPSTQTCLDFGFGCLPNAYLWQDGELMHLGVDRDGVPAANGSVVGRGVTWGPTDRSNQQTHTSRAMSDDGSRVYYTLPASPPTSLGPDGIAGAIHLRENGSVVLVTDPQREVPDPAGTQPATFLTATPDGSVALFTSCEKLTEDSTADTGGAVDCAGSKNDLYRYDAVSGALTDLSATLASSVENVIGISDDGSHVYFGAGDQIHLWRDGELVSVGDTLATATPSPATDVWPFIIGNAQQAAVSRDGRYLAFSTNAPQPGADARGTRQVHVYDAATSELRCASCAPQTGSELADAVLRPLQVSVASVVEYSQRNIDDAGRHVFFETATSLAPEDVNGQVDVYRYDTETGQRVLVSEGRGQYDSHFGDASADGGAVFFTTRDRLIPDLDRDALEDLYVARRGAVAHVPPVAVPECTDDACQGPLAVPPERTTPGTASFQGPDDGPVRVEPVDVLSVRRISAARLRAAARTGRLRVEVRISSGGTVSAVAQTRGRRGRVVARATRRVASGGDVELRLRLSRPARRQLRARGRLPLALVVRYSKAGAPDRTALTLVHPRQASRRTSTRPRRGGLR